MKRAADALRGIWRTWRHLIEGRVQDGWDRVQLAAFPNLQAALVSTLAYVVAAYGVGHAFPIFAPVACYLSMGFTRSRTPRRVLEMGLGATLGVGIGEAFAHYAGFGVVQLLLILLLAPLIGRFIDHSELVTYQAAMQSVTVIGLAMTTVVTGPVALGRWIDALVGTLCALLYTFANPNRPSATPLRRAKAALAALARATATLADGVRAADDATLQEVWRRTRAARRQLNEGYESLRWANQVQIVTWRPRYRDDPAILEEIGRIYALAERAAGSIELTTRYARGEVAAHGPAPGLAGLIGELAEILGNLAVAVGNFAKPEYARRRAADLARRLDPEGLDEDDSWRSLVIVSLLRSTVMDVLQMTGLSRAQAWTVLPDTDRLPREEVCPPEDEASSAWGGEGGSFG